MDQGLVNGTTSRMGAHCFSYLRYNPNELVFGMKLLHGTTKWDILRETFSLNFIFEDGFECIDEVIQEIKEAIFRMPKEAIEWAQPDWST